VCLQIQDFQPFFTSILHSLAYTVALFIPGLFNDAVGSPNYVTAIYPAEKVL
jgi:hypothetical protein